MSIEIVDISTKLRDYLLASGGITDQVGDRIYVGPFPKKKEGAGGEVKSQDNPKISFRQNGGSPKGFNYRYTFICRADTLIDARKVAILVANRLTKEAFELNDDDGNNIAYWAELEGSLLDDSDDVTGDPEVFFNVNYEAQ